MPTQYISDFPMPIPTHPKYEGESQAYHILVQTVMTSVWHCSEEKGIKYFTSPDAEKILISHKGRIYILHLLTW